MLNLLPFSWKKISFSLKFFSGHFYGQFFTKTVRGPLDPRDMVGKIYVGPSRGSLNIATCA